jgi:hypothetical protein
MDRALPTTAAELGAQPTCRETMAVMQHQADARVELLAGTVLGAGAALALAMAVLGWWIGRRLAQLGDERDYWRRLATVQMRADHDAAERGR